MCRGHSRLSKVIQNSNMDTDFGIVFISAEVRQLKEAAKREQEQRGTVSMSVSLILERKLLIKI